MARPMTAADRAPQVGDVLRYHGRDVTVGITVGVAGGRFARWYTKGGRIAYPLDSPWHKYVSRADGGPVTVEEGG